ncbi:MAG TPA: trypsin-like peptidase domain-containing protein [Candidatus Acidoferrales bacterium]|nr:trypsin-like peptidase domain-containing protein [Candidatus Acidoferrales bacterium]
MKALRRALYFAGLVLFLWPFCLPGVARADTLTITSTPPGATVEVDGAVIGTTPLEKKYPGGYFHKPHTVFGARLDHALVARISLAGYVTQQIDLTDGPEQWISFTGKSYGDYWIFKSDHFSVTLVPISQPISGKVELTTGDVAATSLETPKSAEDVVREASPAVVRIEGDKAIGSGFFITNTGVIATNRHVVEDQTGLSVKMGDGRVLPATVAFQDPSADLALLKVDGNNFPHLPLAGIEEVKRGESVIAIGNPGGGLPNTVTRGVVSAVGYESALGRGPWIQTDASINPGNSGGPLLDERGNVIGINSLKVMKNGAGQPVEGIYFALSSQALMTALRRYYPESVSSPTGRKEEGVGSVSVTSVPPGAEIYLDGKFVGDTPSVLQVSAGVHKIRIEAPGKKPFERELNVLKDSQITLNATLESNP